MNVAPKNIVVLGSTGSIGRNVLDIVAASPHQFKIIGLTAHTQLELLIDQGRRFKPKWIAATNGNLAQSFDWPVMDCDLVQGTNTLNELVCEDEIDLIVSAIVGMAGLESNWAALGAGKTIALANKETLVVAGKLAMERAREAGAAVLPIDSEHSAIFQASKAGRIEEIERVILTASGGPFRDLTTEEMARATVAETLAHPTWTMGRKITVDSATMMNKALEVIEARWLFDLPPEKISVVIHPESIVHSLVEFRDGSVLAQLSPPDMRLPIQYAMTYPYRIPGPTKRMNWQEVHQLNFRPPDLDRFPALRLGFEVARMGGTGGVTLNAANEVAVDAFLEQKIAFNEIVQACQEVLERHHFITDPTFDDIIAADRWAREETNQWILT